MTKVLFLFDCTLSTNLCSFWHILGIILSEWNININLHIEKGKNEAEKNEDENFQLFL